MNLFRKSLLLCLVISQCSCDSEPLEMEEIPAVDSDDYQTRSRALRVIDGRISAKLRQQFGADWENTPYEQRQAILTKTEKQWEALRYYYEAALVNSGDIVTYVPLVYDHLEAFTALGAARTIEVAEKLRPHVEKIQSFDSQDAKDRYWSATLEQRKPLEETVEDSREFARLLIQFAEGRRAQLGIDTTIGEQVSAGQPATRSKSNSEGGDKPQLEAEGRSR